MFTEKQFYFITEKDSLFRRKTVKNCFSDTDESLEKYVSSSREFHMILKGMKSNRTSNTFCKEAQSWNKR